MLPEALIAKFWQDVERTLVRQYRLPAPDAEVAVQKYRVEVDDHDTSAPNFNRGVESVAETVAAGWKSGFLKRQPARTTP